MCMNALPSCMYANQLCVCSSWSQKYLSDLLKLELGMNVSCPLGGKNLPNSGPLQEKQIFLTMKPSLETLQN